MPSKSDRAVPLSLKVPSRLAVELKRAAQADKRSVASWVRIVVEQELERRRVASA